MLLKVQIRTKRITLHWDRMPGGGGITASVLWRGYPGAEAKNFAHLSTRIGDVMVGDR